MSTAPKSTVTVTGLTKDTSQVVLEQFFSFCGKIRSVGIVEEEGKANVTFEKESAARTALMLTGGTLNGNVITVTSDDVENPTAAKIAENASNHPTPAEKDGEDVEQEDKPHSAVVAEYLAHGYQLSDSAITKAIEADKHYGISSRFLSFFNPLYNKVTSAAEPHVAAVKTKAAEVDEKQGLTLKASAASTIGLNYYRSALATPFGAKVHAFYTNTSKQVLDVHEEAKRIKERKSSATGTTETEVETPASPAGSASTAEKVAVGPGSTPVA